MYKYLFYIILGILLYILLNNHNTFNIGIPYRDNSIYTLPLESTTKDKYRYCLLSMDDLNDVHYIICIIHLDDSYFQGDAEPSDLIKVYTLGYSGDYTSPNSYSVRYNKPLVNVDTLNQFNDLLFIPWDDLDDIVRRNAIILGWKKSMWDIVFYKTMSVYISYYYEKYSEPDLDYVYNAVENIYKKLLLLNSSLSDENLFNVKWDIENEETIEQSRSEIHKLMRLNLSNPDTFPTNSYEKYNPDKPNTFDVNLNWDELSEEQIQAATFFDLNSKNWNNNKWYINLKSLYFLPNLSKYRKVIDWSDLTDTQFDFLKFLKQKMLDKNNTRVESMNFCPFDERIRGNSLITMEDFKDPSRVGFYGEQCTTDGCCLDGAVSFLYDDRLIKIMAYMDLTHRLQCATRIPEDSCNIM